MSPSDYFMIIGTILISHELDENFRGIVGTISLAIGMAYSILKAIA